MVNTSKRIDEPAEFRKLAEVLPLKAPFSILLDPCNLCNFQCAFCPTGHPDLLKQVKRPNGLMDFNLFCKTINDIGEFGLKLEKLNLYKDGEPFLNKNFVRMVAYAKEKDVAKNICTTSNGALINESLAIGLIEAGLDLIRISVEHVTDEGYKKITGTSVTYALIRKNVEFLFKAKQARKSALKVYVKIIDTGLSDGEKAKFIKDFSEISDFININPIDGRNTASGHDFTLGHGLSSATAYANTKLKVNRIVCPDPFYSLAINFNGLVSPCCVDWSLGAILGDLKKESLADVWRGEKLRQFRLLQLSGQRKKIGICQDCQVVLMGSPAESDLDDKAKDLYALYDVEK